MNMNKTETEAYSNLLCYVFGVKWVLHATFVSAF